MVKTVSATEAKNRLGALLGDLESSEDAVIIENRGVETAAIIPIERFRALKEFELADQRRRAYEDLLKLREEFKELQKDLTAEEAESLLDEITKEIREDRKARFKALRQRRAVS